MSWHRERNKRQATSRFMSVSKLLRIVSPQGGEEMEPLKVFLDGEVSALTRLFVSGLIAPYRDEESIFCVRVFVCEREATAKGYCCVVCLALPYPHTHGQKNRVGKVATSGYMSAASLFACFSQCLSLSVTTMCERGSQCPTGCVSQLTHVVWLSCI